MSTEKIIDFANNTYASGVVLLQPDGTPYTASGGGGGGAGDASAANQVAGNASLSSIDAKTAPASVVSAVNSTIVPLGISGAFTGGSFDALGFSSITVSVFTNQASATDGLQVQQSIDNTNWDLTDAYTVPITAAGQAKTFSIPVQARYIRIVYTNGTTAQTVFRMATIVHTYKPRAASIRPQDARTNDNDFDETASYAMLFNGTTWDRARGTTTNGALVDCSRIVAALPAGTNTIGNVQVYPTTTATAGLVPVSTAALASALTLKGAAGNLYSVNLVTGASAGYFMLFNATTAPADGAVAPVKVWQVAANSERAIDFPVPIRLTTGATLVFSTTGPFTKTASATAFMSGEIA